MNIIKGSWLNSIFFLDACKVLLFVFFKKKFYLSEKQKERHTERNKKEKEKDKGKDIYLFTL